MHIWNAPIQHIRMVKSANFIVQFHQWERNARSAALFDEPVDIEPVFKPFYFKGYTGKSLINDKNALSLLDKIKLLFRKSEAVQNDLEKTTPTSASKAFTPAGAGKKVCVRLEKSSALQNKTSDSFFAQLATVCQDVFSVELIFINGLPSIQLTVDEKDAQKLHSILNQNGISFSTDAIDLMESMEVPLPSITDLTFDNNFIYPISSIAHLSLYDLPESIARENLAVQILFKPVINSWQKNILEAVGTGLGGKEIEPGIASFAKQKTDTPLYATVIRCISTSEVTTGVLQQAISEKTQSTVNKLVPCSNNNYHPVNHWEDVILRQSHRVGIIMNQQELAGFVQLPPQLENAYTSNAAHNSAIDKIS